MLLHRMLLREQVAVDYSSKLTRAIICEVLCHMFLIFRDSYRALRLVATGISSLYTVLYNGLHFFLFAMPMAGQVPVSEAASSKGSLLFHRTVAGSAAMQCRS